jgi:hypothetical protein
MNCASLALVGRPKTIGGEGGASKIASCGRHATNYIRTMSFCATDPYQATKGPPQVRDVEIPRPATLVTVPQLGRCWSLPLEWSEEGASSP